MRACAAEWQVEPQNGEARTGKSVGHFYQEFGLAVRASSVCEYDCFSNWLRRLV
jgi:hypothetical protein